MTIGQETIERVLVVPTFLFRDIGHFQGFHVDTGPYLDTLLDPAWTSYRPRDEIENDPEFKQLIPYCIFRHRHMVFHYRRGREQGEARLHSRRSIGVGGHICTLDQTTSGSPYVEGMRREIAEEVYLDTTYNERCIGLINDDETEVGRVHLGIVHIFDLDEPKVRPREQSIKDSGFASPADLVSDRGSFETWSQICLDHLQQSD